jgi:hypothetical protein
MQTLSFEPSSAKALFEAGEEHRDIGTVHKVVGPSVFEVPDEVQVLVQPESIRFTFAYPNEEPSASEFVTSAQNCNIHFRLARHTRKIIELYGKSSDELLTEIDKDDSCLVQHISSAGVTVPKSAARNYLVVGRLLAEMPREIRKRISALQKLRDEE